MRQVCCLYVHKVQNATSTAALATTELYRHHCHMMLAFSDIAQLQQHACIKEIYCCARLPPATTKDIMTAITGPAPLCNDSRNAVCTMIQAVPCSMHQFCRCYNWRPLSVMFVNCRCKMFLLLLPKFSR